MANRSFYRPIAGICRKRHWLSVGVYIVYGLRLRNSWATQVENRISRLSETGHWMNLGTGCGGYAGKRSLIGRSHSQSCLPRSCRSLASRYIDSITSTTPRAAIDWTWRQTWRLYDSRVDLTQQLRLAMARILTYGTCRVSLVTWHLTTDQWVTSGQLINARNPVLTLLAGSASLLIKVSSCFNNGWH